MRRRLRDGMFVPIREAVTVEQIRPFPGGDFPQARLHILYRLGPDHDLFRCFAIRVRDKLKQFSPTIIASNIAQTSNFHGRGKKKLRPPT